MRTLPIAQDMLQANDAARQRFIVEVVNEATEQLSHDQRA
jgi:hypothetical protein